MIRITNRRGKYQYVISPKERFPIKVVGILRLFSLIFLSIGFLNFVRMNEIAEAIFTIPFAVIFLYHFINSVLMASYPGFDLEKHKQHIANFWADGRQGPRVGILIPVAGEEISVVRKTIKAAMGVDYDNFVVVLCDDTPTQKYKPLAKSTGCKYINHDKPGVRKKAGNVNYALSQCPDIEQVLILDADFVPRPEILRELVPYSGDYTGIVQSPQHFRATDDIFYRSKTEFGAALMQKDFYRIVQVSRDRFDSAICVGTNALYNREALDRVGGFEGVGGDEPWTHSEDVNTGLKMINTRLDDGQPYHIRYLPIQLATGVCPDNYYSFYKQQARWATGSTRLMFSPKTLFSKVLRPIQKFCYFSNALYYLYTISILTMPLYFVVLILTREGFSWHYTAYFIPQLVTTYLIMPFVLRREYEPLSTTIAVSATAYTFIQAIILSIIRRPIGWEATGSKAGGSGSRFSQYKKFVMIYALGAYGAAMAIAILKHAFAFNASVILQALFILGYLAQVIHLAYLFEDAWLSKKLLTLKKILTAER